MTKNEGNKMENKYNEWKIDTPLKKTLYVMAVASGILSAFLFLVGFVSELVRLY